MSAWLTPDERRTLAVVLTMVAAGYLLVGWRSWRQPEPPVPLDSLDLAFIRLGAALGSDSAAAATASAAKEGRAAAHIPSGPIDLNAADSAALLTLPGIGPTKAAGILAWRRRHGRFRRAEDLLEVTGIGPATLEKLRQQILIRSPRSGTEVPDTLKPMRKAVDDRPADRTQPLRRPDAAGGSGRTD